MRDKIKEICEPTQLKTMYMVEVESLTLDVLKQIGYAPSKNIKENMDRTWVNSSREDYIYDFIYNVYRRDTGEL